MHERIHARTLALLLAFLAPAGCAADTDPIEEPPRSAAVTTTGPWSSMIYLARVEGGVIAIDLGWLGSGAELDEGLAQLGAAPVDVIAVFLTHSHRDHVAGWQAVRQASFHMGAPEVPVFLGRAEHDGPVPAMLADFVPIRRPEPGELDVHGFAGDTAFVFGADTLRAFLVPGHTAGSAAYLFRGILFLGDAVGYTPVRGFHASKWVYSDDVERSRASVEALWRKVDGLPVRFACTAHGRCAVPDSAFRSDALR